MKYISKIVYGTYLQIHIEQINTIQETFVEKHTLFC